MTHISHPFRISLMTALFLGTAWLSSGLSAMAQPHGKGKGQRAGNPAMQADMEIFHFLLDHRDSIRRKVTATKDGVETITESEKPEIAKNIQEHLASMHQWIKSGNGIHLRDPLFAEIFQNYDKISMEIVKTEKGVKVTETSKDARVVKLIQAHAEVVTKFIQNGHEEVRKNHSLPGEAAGLVYPIIKGFGGVVVLPQAVEQPAIGAKIVMDVTGGPDPTKVNPGLERAARLLNLYGSAKLAAMDVTISVVLHGERTKAALAHEAYAKQFRVAQNPIGNGYRPLLTPAH